MKRASELQILRQKFRQLQAYLSTGKPLAQLVRFKLSAVRNVESLQRTVYVEQSTLSNLQ